MKTALKIVGIIGLVFWIACCFFGLFYSTNGNWLFTIAITLLIVVALFLSYFLMLKMQDKTVTQGNRDRAKRTGIIMLCVYVVAALFSAFYINHLVNVETERKKTVKDTTIKAVAELRTSYNSYDEYVSEAVATYETKLLEQGLKRTDEKFETDAIDFENYLLGISDSGETEVFKAMETEVFDFLDNVETATKKWNVFTGPKMMGMLSGHTEEGLEKKKPAYEEWLANWAKSKEDEEYDKYPFLRDEQQFTFTSNVDCSNLTKPLTQADFKVSGTSILIILALQVIILLGYLLGLKTGGKNDKIVTDDHGSMRSWSSSN